MHHREAHQAGQQEAVRMRHDSFVAIGPDRQQVHAQLSTYCKLGTSFLTVSIMAGGVE
jgi:hypothetical protein